MSNIVGGLRRRLIKDNLYNMLYETLDQLNWLESGVELLPEMLNPDENIVPTKVAISSEDLTSEEWEMGTDLDENTWDIYIDIFAPDESVGIHLSGDIYDILRGKFSSVNRTNPIVAVYDLTQEGEPFLFNVGIDAIELVRVREWEKPHQKYWWIIGFQLIDYYYGEA